MGKTLTKTTSSSLAVIESDAVVVNMIRVRTALAEAVTISQTKKIMDVAAAAEIYARRQHLSEEAEQMAATVKVEALRKLGEMLQAAPKATGAKGIGKKSAVPEENRTLAELGLTKKESAIAQKLAGLSEEAFEQVSAGHVTIAKAIAAVNAEKKEDTAKSDEAKPGAEKAGKAKKTAAEPKAPDGTTAKDFEVDNLRGAVDALWAANEELTQRLAVEAMDATEEEKLAADDLITELRRQVKVLTAELEATRATRNQLMTTNAELVKSVAHWRRIAAKAEKAAA